LFIPSIFLRFLPSIITLLALHFLPNTHSTFFLPFPYQALVFAVVAGTPQQAYEAAMASATLVKSANF
jgi:hypothetical protein